MVDEDRGNRQGRPIITRRSAVIALIMMAALGGTFAWRRSRTEALDDRLFTAIDRSDAAAVRTLLEEGADPNARRPAGARRERPDMSGGIGIRTPRKAQGETALMAAVDKPPEITRTLLAKGADPRLSGCEHGEWDALMHAARVGAYDNARMLLDKGASVDHHDQIGRSALAFAAVSGRANMVKVLLDYNARPNVEDLSGMSPLLYALFQAPQKDRIPCMDLLLTYNAVPDQGIHGTTALMWAIEHDKPDVVAVLLKHHASVNGLFMAGKSTLRIAREKGNPRIVRMLLRAGAKD